ncbi:MAG: aspartate kinase [Phycisphaerales bacterium]
MPTLVMKFGGTSVADPERIRRAARRVAEAKADGHQVAVVVSAMGHTTDELIGLAGKVAREPARRELDALMSTGEAVSAALTAMALEDQGLRARSLNAFQCAMRTDGGHGRARLEGVDADGLQRMLEQGVIPVVTGFQGIAASGDITTLGRGGSDTTAVAIAAALAVQRDGGCCEIYTDVDGVHTADPRLVPDAPKLGAITYDEMLELAAMGAGVMHARAVVFGQRHGVPIHVRHSQRPEPGTMIQRETPHMESIAVIGCALKTDLGRVHLQGLPRTAGVQGLVFSAIASRGLIVDDIIQTEGANAVDLAFTVEHGDLPEVKTAVGEVLQRLGSGRIDLEIGLAKVSAVGTGMRSHAGVASRMFQVLGDAGVPIRNITTSEIRISCLVPQEHGERSLRLVHEAFGLALGERVTLQRQLGTV